MLITPPLVPVLNVIVLFVPLARTRELPVTLMLAPRVVTVMLPPGEVELLLTIARSCVESWMLTPWPAVRWLLTLIVPPTREP